MRRYFLIIMLICALLLTACTSKAAKKDDSDTKETVTEETADQTNDASANLTEESTAEEQTADNNSPADSLTSSETTTKSTAEQTTVTDNAILHVYGDGVKQERWFSMAQLKAMGNGYAEAEYYYKGKDPDEGHSLCKGVRLAYLLDTVVGLTDSAKKVTIKASDGYGAGYSLSTVRKTYIDETDTSKQLYMILAWCKDGQSSDSLCLVMGQNVAGEYNRTYWVRDVATIEVKTQ